MPKTITPPQTQETSGLKPYFARHETFHPRYGWLKKAVDRLDKNASVFTDEDAPVILGVGKNMVTAIRYWAYAFKLIEEQLHDEQRKWSVSTLGHNLLLSENAWDPYLEDLGSLWLLHWHLLKAPCYASAWHFFFNEYPHSSFTIDDAVYSLESYTNTVFSAYKTASSSLRKDLSCILRMYTESDGEKKQAREDSIASPFQELGIIQHIRGPYYQFNTGSKPSLPHEIIAYACADFAQNKGTAKTINISALLYDVGSPGQVFKLNESSLRSALEYIDNQDLGLHISESAGLIQLLFDQDPLFVAKTTLESYYKQ